MQNFKLIFILCFWLILSGCGGGGSGSSVTNTSSSVAPATFTVSVSASPGGSYALPNPQVTAGQTNKVTATPDSGYIVNSFSGCGAGVVDYNNYTTAPIVADCSVAITFKRAGAIEGTAAEGAALVNADITAKCSDGSGFSGAVKTDAAGHFTGLVGETAFPCALKLTSATKEKTYFSLARVVGTTNITPLTDLSLVVASGKSGADWYAGANWTDAGSQLDTAQSSIKDRLYDMGYVLPAEFKPFTSNFIIGDTWDVLLDQLKAGLEKSNDVKTYIALVSSVNAKGVNSIPSPIGNDVLTAEVCFNPDLFAVGMTYLTKTRSETIHNDSGGTAYGSEWASTYLNKKIVSENGISILYRDMLSDFTSFYPGSVPATSTYVEKIAVDLIAKSITYMSSEGTSTSTIPGGSLYSSMTSYDTAGRKTSFKVAVGIEIFDKYVEHSTRFFLTNGQEGSRSESNLVFEDKRTFKGLTSIERLGKMRRVCEFNVKRKITQPDLTFFENSFPEYYLLGTGLDVTRTDLKLITLNGKEI